jgi:hypothetical protein
VPKQEIRKAFFSTERTKAPSNDDTYMLEEKKKPVETLAADDEPIPATSTKK